MLESGGMVHAISAFLRHTVKCSDSEDDCRASRSGSHSTDGHSGLQTSGKLLSRCDISRAGEALKRAYVSA